MKIKKFFKFILILFFLFSSAYFIFCLITNYSPEKFLPPFPQAVVSVNQPKKILNEYSFLLDEYEEFKPIKKFLPFVPNLQIYIVNLSSGPILIVDSGYWRGLMGAAFFLKDWFFKAGEGIYLEENPLLEKDVFILKDGTETLGFVAHRRNILIVSPYHQIIKIALGNYDSVETPPKIEKSGDISIFFRPTAQIKKFLSLYPQLEFMKEILDKHESGNAKIYFQDNSIKTEIVLKLKKPETYQEKVIEKFLQMDSWISSFYEKVPLRTSSFASFSTEDLEKVYQYLILLLKNNKKVFSDLKMGNDALKFVTDKGIRELFFSWTGNEMGSLTLSNSKEPVLFIEIKDKAVFFDSFKPFIGEKAKESGEYEIYKIDLPGLFNFIKNIFAPSIELPYFTVFDDKYLIIANNPKEIENFLNLSHQVKLNSDKSYEIVKQNTDQNAHIHFYVDLSYGHLPVANLSPIIKKMLEKYYKAGGSIRFDYPEIKIDFTVVKN